MENNTVKVPNHKLSSYDIGLSAPAFLLLMGLYTLFLFGAVVRSFNPRYIDDDMLNESLYQILILSFSISYTMPMFIFGYTFSKLYGSISKRNPPSAAYVQGLNDGEVDGVRGAIANVVKARFGSVPPEVTVFVSSINELNKLKAMFRESVSCSTIAEWLISVQMHNSTKS